MSDKPSGVDEQKAIITEAVQAEQTKTEAEAQKTAAELTGQSKLATMQVKVYSPYKDYFDSPAISLSAENLTGPFDILPKHHNFMSLLSPCELFVRTIDKGQQLATRILISGGLLYVKADQVIIFLDV